MAGLLTDSLSETFPMPSTAISGTEQSSESLVWSFTAAGLSGTYTRFPFNLPPEYMGSKNQFGVKYSVFFTLSKLKAALFLILSFEWNS